MELNLQLNEGGAELLRTSEMAENVCNIGEWLDKKLEKLKDFVSPEIFAIIAPETSSTEQQSTTTQDPSSTEVVGLEPTALSSSPKQQSPGVVRRFGSAITENEVFAIIAPETSSTEQSTTTQGPSSTEVVGLEPTAPSPSPKQQSPGVVRRFGPAITENELLTAIETRVPIKTKKTTTWGVNVWREWTQCRRVSETIESMEETDINSHMARFVQEVRRKDGKDYPASSLNNLVAAIQRYLRENGRPEVNFYDQRNPAFDLLRKSLDARMKALTRGGVGVMKRQAQPITPEMENTLWENGIFGCNTSRGLLNVVFWYSCKLFGLRAADEHKRLEPSQFICGDDENGDFLRYIGRSCKNWQGGLNHRKVEAKDLTIYADPSLGSRCAVSCFKLYLSLIPTNGHFYYRPIGDNPPRFSAQVIGIHKLENTVKDFCQQAGFQGFFTNHSGKVTCATELFKHNIDEQLIMKQTGHRSVDAVRLYKRPSVEHKLQVSGILQAPAPKKAAILNLNPTSFNKAGENSEFEPPSTCRTGTKTITFSAKGNSVQNIHITL